MINKIGNWVFGSFFRTIGRLLVFILLGVIIANLVDFGALIDNFRITDLFFEKVDALSLDGQFTGENFVFNTETQLVRLTDNEEKTIPFTTSFNTGDNDYAVFPINGIKYFQYDTSTEESVNFNYTSVQTYVHVYLMTNQNWTACEFQNNFLVCPVPHNATANYLRFTFDMGETFGTAVNTITFNIYRNVNMYKNTSNAIINEQQQTTDAITNQTQQQQQQHQELMDDNTTEADTEGQDFINNFSNNSHGLTGIITAPLNAIQSISSATCSPLVLPLPFMSNRSLTLPCMNSIYSQHFGAFYIMYQGIILALISYWVCVRLFTLVKGFKDPEDDKIEVMDL